MRSNKPLPILDILQVLCTNECLRWQWTILHESEHLLQRIDVHPLQCIQNAAKLLIYVLMCVAYYEKRQLHFFEKSNPTSAT
jgi:hypothetical protein